MLYIIPAKWEVSGYFKVEAESLEDALYKVEYAPLPKETEFSEESFEVAFNNLIRSNQKLNNLTKEEVVFIEEMCESY